jgi:hypothetical protein
MMKAVTTLWTSLAAGLLVACLLAACAPQPGLTPDSPADTLPVETVLPYPPPRTPVVVLNGPAYPAPAASATPAQIPAGPTPTPDLFTYQRDARQSTSPDGRYAARIVVAMPQLSDGTLVGDTYHVQVSVVDFQDNNKQVVVDEWRNYGLGYTTPDLLGWSADSKDFFMVESGVPDGCGPLFYENLRRVEVESNHSTLVAENPGRAPALSPDGSRLASIGEGDLLVSDFESGDQLAIPFETPSTDYWADGITWSPDGGRLLFSATLNPCGAYEELSSSLYLADLASGSIRSLLEADSRQLGALSWPLDDLVQLRDPGGQDYWLTVSTGEVREEAPPEVKAAREALYGFFAALQAGRYAEAAELYSGSYEGLQDNNPEVDPQDRAALLENGCRLNGFQCLAVYRAVLKDQPSPGEFRFRVVFEHEGQPFSLGPCCGADIAEMPPQSEFLYTVKQDEQGNYRVTELPVYVP